MARAVTLTTQPIVLTAVGRQALFLSIDVSAFDSLDLEAVCTVGGTASGAQLNLITGMQTQTEDGWVPLSPNFASVSGTGQQILRATVSTGLLQYLRWDVSSVGGATSFTFFIRGIARNRIGGGSSTFAATYAAGSSRADSTAVLNAARGPVTLEYDALASAHTAALALVNTTPAVVGGQQQSSPGLALTGQGTQTTTNTSQPAGWQVQATPFEGTVAGSSLDFYSNSNGTLTSRLHLEVPTINNKDGTILSGDSSKQVSLYLAGPTDNYFRLTAGTVGIDANYYYAQGLGLYAHSGGIVFQADGYGPVIPGYDLNNVFGNATHRWTEVWSARYASVEQTVANAASITLNSASGSYIRVTLGATATTSVAAGTGYPGEVMTTAIIQDATGGRTISGWSSSFVFAGGTYTATSTANKRDLLTWRWDATASKWYEQSRSMNL